jgi:hypothetical protein
MHSNLEIAALLLWDSIPSNMTRWESPVGMIAHILTPAKHNGRTQLRGDFSLVQLLLLCDDVSEH